jgi:hypothetical protein
MAYRRCSATLTSALDESEWPASCPCRFTLGERSRGTSRICGSVGLRSGLDTVEQRKISCTYRELNAGRPARSLSRYRLLESHWVLSLNCRAYRSPNVTGSRLVGNFRTPSVSQGVQRQVVMMNCEGLIWTHLEGSGLHLNPRSWWPGVAVTF